MKPPILIAVTQSTIDGQTPEEFIAYTARISNPSNQSNNESAPKLLTYLVKNSHWSPFDMVDMLIEVTTSKAVAIQLLRHWSFRFQEFSQRYSEVSELGYAHVEMRVKHGGGNRQGSGAVGRVASVEAQDSCVASGEDYAHLITGRGVAPESARMVLPMATLTTLYVKGSVRSWMTYFWQRCDPHAQKEHQELALQIFAIFCAEFPHLGKLVETHKPSVVEKDWMAHV